MPSKKAAVKLPTIRSYNVYEPSIRLTFQLQRSRVEQLPRFEGDIVYQVTRKNLKKLLKQIDAGTATPLCEIDFSGDYTGLESVNYEATPHSRGRFQLGCQVFSASAVKAIRQWAGSTGKK